MNFDINLEFLKVYFYPKDPKNPNNVSDSKGSLGYLGCLGHKGEIECSPGMGLYAARNGEQYKVQLRLGKYANIENETVSFRDFEKLIKWSKANPVKKLQNTFNQKGNFKNGK